MAMDIVIKKMETDSEIRGKAYVHWKSWQEAYAGIIDQNDLEELTLEKCISTAYRWPDNIIIAKDGEKVIGFAGYGRCRDEEPENTGEVFAIYLLKDYYGQGIGYRMMQEALTLLKDYQRAAVWVLKENRQAIHFYERCGFRFDGREKTIKLGSPAAVVRMLLVR